MTGVMMSVEQRLLVVAICVITIVMGGCGSNDVGTVGLGGAGASQDPAPMVTPTASTTPADEPVPAATSTSGQYDAVWTNGYTYSFDFDAGYENVTSDVAYSPPGKSKLSFDWQVDLTVTNITEGRFAPPPARIFGLEGAWPANSLMCNLVDGAGGIPPIRNPAGDLEEFPYCLFDLVSLSGEMDDQVQSAEDIAPGADQVVTLSGTYEGEFDEEFTDAAVSDLQAGPAMWVAGGFALDPVVEGSDDCYSLLWYSSPQSPCDTPQDGSVVDGSTSAEDFAGRWTGPITMVSDGETTGTADLDIEVVDGEISGTLEFSGGCGVATITRARVVLDVLSIAYNYNEPSGCLSYGDVDATLADNQLYLDLANPTQSTLSEEAYLTR